MVLIQGPPGTGKTYLGLKIVETLFKNRFKVMNKYCKSSLSPILIVCYTKPRFGSVLGRDPNFLSKRLSDWAAAVGVKPLKPFTLRHGRRSNDNTICSKNIIGMTTTGAAKFRHIVERIDAKIVVIEEAAEVLESHVITSLAKNTEQLILIGDHQQLRPQTADYDLSKYHYLNISLFERMIKNGIPFNQLNLQHRMRPEISGLLTPHIYKELKNHDIVYSYENIRGFYWFRKLFNSFLN